MRLQTYSSGRRRIHRAVVGLTRLVGSEIDDVGKIALRRPDFFGKPFLDLAQASLRRPSRWSVGERELFAAVVSRANSCQFCVGTHAEIAGKELRADVLADWQDGRFGPRATAAARFVDTLTRSPQSLTAEDVQQTRTAGVDDIALARPSTSRSSLTRSTGSPTRWASPIAPTATAAEAPRSFAGTATAYPSSSCDKTPGRCLAAILDQENEALLRDSLAGVDLGDWDRVVLHYGL
jgi:hypothetical protein